MWELRGPSGKTALLASVWFDRTRKERIWKLPGRIVGKIEEEKRKNRGRDNAKGKKGLDTKCQ